MCEIVHGLNWILAAYKLLHRPRLMSLETSVCQNHPKSSDSVSGVACFGAELPTFAQKMKNYRKADEEKKELKCHPFAPCKCRNGSQCCCKARTVAGTL